MGISALINVGLNLLLIPTYSYPGSGIASILSQAFVFTCEFIYLQKNGYKIDASKSILKPVCSGVVMGCIIYILKEAHANFFIIIFCAIIIYVICLYLLKALDESEIKMAKGYFRIMHLSRYFK
jgi:O-antigen/teichoic acid export membrane protein